MAGQVVSDRWIDDYGRHHKKTLNPCTKKCEWHHKKVKCHDENNGRRSGTPSVWRSAAIEQRIHAGVSFRLSRCPLRGRRDL
jgi:hypothetical protein